MTDDIRCHMTAKSKCFSFFIDFSEYMEGNKIEAQPVIESVHDGDVFNETDKRRAYSRYSKNLHQ
jgi:hypothetical protein